MEQDNYSYYEEPLFQSAFSDFERAGRSIGLGSIMVGSDDIKRTQRQIRASSLSDTEKFLEEVQLFCYENKIAYNRELYEQIANGFPRPRFLSPSACVLAINYFITSENEIIRGAFDDPSVTAILDEKEMEKTDLYRYAVFISKILRRSSHKNST